MEPRALKGQLRSVGMAVQMHWLRLLERHCNDSGMRDQGLDSGFHRAQHSMGLPTIEQDETQP